MTQQDKPGGPRKGWAIGILAGVGLLLAALTTNIARASDTPTPYQQARQTRDAITRGDYATARRITASVLAESKLQRWRFYPFDDFMVLVSDVYNPVFGAHVTEWVAHDPSDAIALLISAQYKLDRGWFIRGSDWASRIEPERHGAYADYLTDAIGDVEKSIQRDNRNPYAFNLKLRMLSGFGLHKDFLPQFRKAIDRFPAYFPLYQTFLQTTEPRWGGSVDAMYVFVDNYAGRAPSNSPLKLLYLSLYFHALAVASETCTDAPGEREAKRKCVETAAGQLVRPEVHEQVKALFSQYDADDGSEFDAVVGYILSEIAGTPYADADTGKLLAMAGEATRSDNKLDPSNPGHGNYAVDLALSNYWHTIGVMDYALKKAKDALLDIENTRFPSAAEKKTALVEVYEQIARLTTDLGRRKEAIEAEDAALGLGVQVYEPSLLCINTYGLKDYARTIAICSKLIADYPGDMETLFWRGQAYYFSNHNAEAEDDLKAVAASSSPRRVNAVMSMAMVRLQSQDFRGAVAVFNQYPFLYDPALVSDNALGLAYMNRCYAYMRLNELQHALSDCDQASQHGIKGGEYFKAQIERQLSAGPKR